MFKKNVHIILRSASPHTRPHIHRWWFVQQRIDGVDIRSLDVQWVRAQLALVSQEPVLFNTTIYDNIVYGDNTRSPTMDEVFHVAKKANIHNFIVSLPLVRSCVVFDYIYKYISSNGMRSKRLLMTYAHI